MCQTMQFEQQEKDIKTFIKISIVILFAIIIFISYISFANAAVVDNIKAYYNFSTDGTDSTRTYNMTLTGSPTISAGFSDNAITTASGKYALIANDMGITGTSITMSAWIKPSSYPAGVAGDNCNNFNYVPIFSSDAGTNVKYMICLNNVSGTPKVCVDRLKENIADVSSCYTYTTPTTSWTHIAMTYNGSETALYVNGVYRNGTVTSGNGGGGTRDETIAGFRRQSDDAAQSYFVGQIDEFGIWNTAKTSTEIASIYNSGAGLFYPFVAPANPINISSLTPTNYTFSDTGNKTFTFNVTSITGTWNTTLWLNNSQSYGINNTISTIGVYTIYGTNLPAGHYLWWINATNGANSNITEKRDFYIAGITGGTATKICTFNPGTIALANITGCN